eukprot:7342492-Prymnesium_polylepis.1
MPREPPVMKSVLPASDIADSQVSLHGTSSNTPCGIVITKRSWNTTGEFCGAIGLGTHALPLASICVHADQN